MTAAAAVVAANNQFSLPFPVPDLGLVKLSSEEGEIVGGIFVVAA